MPPHTCCLLDGMNSLQVIEEEHIWLPGSLVEAEKMQEISSQCFNEQQIAQQCQVVRVRLPQQLRMASASI
ncbi:hypothetical protein A6X21_15865 [Planctopirus hydrillae]|uniref:Uncharacterized protein n=1 Tax=Planctopirus hydrillae TaxID=1841610 RepID=A0A1C3ETM0_9PLAN|nr:hypothetical protein A6X21_15865 [Planctopirus hydrillae]